jgi:NaMN:DMB phosphoribosyltransferase
MANGTIAASQLEMLSLSGTGIITITPPATNTNRTLTLPDATGTVLAGTTSASTTNTVTTKIAVNIGGTVYYVLASTSGA